MRKLEDAKNALRVSGNIRYWREVKDRLDNRDDPTSPISFSSQFHFGMELEVEQVMAFVDAKLKEAEDKLAALEFEYDEEFAYIY